MSNNETVALVAIVTLDGRPIVERQTDRALLLEIEDGRPAIWLPKSQISGFWHTPAGVWLVASPFIVREKGLSGRSTYATEHDLAAAERDGRGAWL